MKANDSIDSRELSSIWSHLESDFENHIKERADSLGLPRSELLSMLADDVLRRSAESFGTLQQHWLDGLLIAGLLAAVAVFSVVARQSFPHGRSNQVTVTAKGGIAPLHIISAQDIAVQNVPTTDGSLDKPEHVVGHYTLRWLAPGTIVRSQELSAGTMQASEFAGRQAIALPVKPGAAFVKDGFPRPVSVIMSPRDNITRPILIEDAYLLSFSGERDISTALLALKYEDLRSVISQMGRSEVTISDRLR